MPGGVLTAVDQVSVLVNVSGLVILSVSGTWVGVIVLERSMDEGSTFQLVESFIENYEGHLKGLGEIFRLRADTFKSGTVSYFIGQPPQ